MPKIENESSPHQEFRVISDIICKRLLLYLHRLEGDHATPSPENVRLLSDESKKILLDIGVP
jgi:hypothetical protein